MTKREATRLAQSELSQVYRTSANGNQITYGFSRRLESGWACESGIGSYAQARKTRSRAIASRVAELLGEMDPGVFSTWPE